MPELQRIADAITAQAGWKKAAPDTTGEFVFRLEGDLVMRLFSPGTRRGMLLSDLGPAPEPDAGEAALLRAAKTAAGAMKARRSILSVTPAPPFRLELSRGFDLTAYAHPSMRSTLLREVRDFLNDLAWWKRHFADSVARPEVTSPFSIGQSWFKL